MEVKIPGLYLKHGRYYWQPPTTHGVRPKPIALRTPHFHEAVMKIEEYRHRPDLRSQASDLETLIEVWKRAKSAGHEHRGAGTERTRRPAMKRFAKAFSSPGRITTAALERWKAGMIGDGLSTATVAGYMRYAQSFCSWLVKKGHLVENPFDDVRFPKSVPTKRDRALTKVQRDLLIRTCKCPDLKAVLFLGFHAGMRRNEILNLRREWLIIGPDGSPSHIRIQNEGEDDGRNEFDVKDREAKIVPVTRPLALFLALEYGTFREPYLVAPQYKPGRHTYRWDFKRRFATHAKACGLPWVTPHVMRTTFVSLLLSADPQNRPSTLHLSRWTGTGEDTLRKHYAHLFDDDRLINASV